MNTRLLFLAAIAALTFNVQHLSAANPMQKGEQFLKENAAKEGVKTLPSGLQYKVIKEGEGKSPKATDTVVVHYKGTLIGGNAELEKLRADGKLPK